MECVISRFINNGITIETKVVKFNKVTYDYSRSHFNAIFKSEDMRDE